MNSNLPPLPQPYQPNADGATLCTVRWMIDTPAGWIGAYDKETLIAYGAACAAAAMAAEREACARQMERLGAHEMAHCLRNGPAPLDDPDLNDQAADYIEQHSDPLMDRINRSGPFADAP